MVKLFASLLLMLSFAQDMAAEKLFVKYGTRDEDGYVGSKTDDQTFLTCHNVELQIERGDQVKKTDKTCSAATISPLGGRIKKLDPQSCRLALTDDRGVDGVFTLSAAQCSAAGQFRPGKRIVIRVDDQNVHILR